jgi:hypothetical protein
MLSQHIIIFSATLQISLLVIFASYRDIVVIHSYMSAHKLNSLGWTGRRKDEKEEKEMKAFGFFRWGFGGREVYVITAITRSPSC